MIRYQPWTREGNSVVMIYAADRCGVIGNGDKLPWHIPEELQHFKRYTTGHFVVMGRKTYESIGRPLPNRYNIVISKRKDLDYPPTVRVVESIDHAMRLVATISESYSKGEINLPFELIDGAVVVIGGAQIYQAFMESGLVDLLVKTRVDLDVASTLEDTSALVKFDPRLTGTNSQILHREHHHSQKAQLDYQIELIRLLC